MTLISLTIFRTLRSMVSSRLALRRDIVLSPCQGWLGRAKYFYFTSYVYIEFNLPFGLCMKTSITNTITFRVPESHYNGSEKRFSVFDQSIVFRDSQGR